MIRRIIDFGKGEREAFLGGDSVAGAHSAGYGDPALHWESNAQVERSATTVGRASPCPPKTFGGGPSAMLRASICGYAKLGGVRRPRPA